MITYKLYPNLLKNLFAILLFALISVLFFPEILKGKKILQPDIVKYTGMSKELKDYRAENNSETYWVNNAFSGMPTYQNGAKHPNNYIKKIDSFLRFLPRPADYIFLYLLCFYILCLSLKIEYKLAFLGSLAFAFSTYLIIIIEAGHNSKAHAIAYIPLVVAGIITVFRKKYFLGYFLSTIALALQFSANHFQMTYYLMFIILILGFYYMIDHYNRNEIKPFLKSILILSGSLCMALMMNASLFMSTYEYSKESQRGSPELTITPNGVKNIDITSGLSREYITEYSYGIFESLNLFIPRIMGGASYEKLDKNSSFYKQLRNFGYSPIDSNQIIKRSPTYWGDQSFIAGPAYLGISVFFLFIFSIFLLEGTEKKWILTAIFVSLLLSYGKNLEFLTDFFIDYFPFYDKFRAVSSIQVIIEFCVPLLAIIGLGRLFKKNDSKYYIKRLYYTLFIFIIILFILFIIKNSLSFTGDTDSILPKELSDSLVNDRRSLYTDDLFRTLIYTLIVFGTLLLYLKNKIKKNITISILGLFIMTDLISFSKNYLNNENFVDSIQVEKPFIKDKYYTEIEKDTSDFRIMDYMDGTKAAYFSNSIDGYSAVKLKSYNNILNFYIKQDVNNITEDNLRENFNLLSMLNTKYFISDNLLQINPNYSGSAWFIKNLSKVSSRDNEILQLETLDFKNKVISSNLQSKKYFRDSFSSINLIEKTSNYLKYQTKINGDGFAVFSEIFYPHGWVSTVNGIEKPHHRVNYLLRGMEIPKGEHIVEFKFDPQVIKTGGKINLIGLSIFLFSLLITGLFNIKKTTH